jgi:hypothetical protein
MTLDPWLAAHTSEAPPALRDRVVAHVAAISDGATHAERLGEDQI